MHTDRSSRGTSTRCSPRPRPPRAVCPTCPAGGVGRPAAISMRAAIAWAALALTVRAWPTAPHGAAASARNATTHAASAVPADLPLSLTPPLPEEETGSSMRTWPVGGADAALLPEVPLAEGPARLASGQPCALDSQCTSRICRCRNNFRRRAEMCEGVGKVCMELLPVGAECHDHRCTRPLHLPSPAAPDGLRARAGRVCRTSATARRTRGGETTAAPTGCASAATGAGATGNAMGRSRWRTPPAHTVAQSMDARCAASSSGVPRRDSGQHLTAPYVLRPTHCGASASPYIVMYIPHACHGVATTITYMARDMIMRTRSSALTSRSARKRDRRSRRGRPGSRVADSEQGPLD